MSTGAGMLPGLCLSWGKPWQRPWLSVTLGCFVLGGVGWALGFRVPEYMWKHYSCCLWALEKCVIYIYQLDQTLVDPLLLVGYVTGPLYFSPNFCLEAGLRQGLRQERWKAPTSKVEFKKYEWIPYVGCCAFCFSHCSLLSFTYSLISSVLFHPWLFSHFPFWIINQKDRHTNLRAFPLCLCYLYLYLSMYTHSVYTQTHIYVYL